MILLRTKCINCQKRISKNIDFCPHCGMEQTKIRKTEPSYTCPHCGASYDVFSCICRYCGEEQIGVVHSKSVLELTSRLEELERKRNNSKISLLLDSTSFTKINKIDEQKINLISTFVVPNSKEDLLEFMVLASSNIDVRVKACHNALEAQMKKKEFVIKKSLCNAWVTKRDQVYNKAKIAFGSDEDFRVFDRLYNEKESEIRKNIKGLFFTRYKREIVVISYIAIMLILSITFFSLNKEDNRSNSPTTLETIQENKMPGNQTVDPTIENSSENTETTVTEEVAQDDFPQVLKKERYKDYSIKKTFSHEEATINDETSDEEWGSYNLETILEKLNIEYDLMLSAESSNKSGDFMLFDFDKQIVLCFSTSKGRKTPTHITSQPITLKYEGSFDNGGEIYINELDRILRLEKDENGDVIVNDYNNNTVITTYHAAQEEFVKKILEDEICQSFYSRSDYEKILNVK